jgi:hypothetical protein
MAVNPIEAARIAAVLEEALEKLALLSLVLPGGEGASGASADAPATGAPPDAASAALIGEEVARTIAAQRELEAR